MFQVRNRVELPCSDLDCPVDIVTFQDGEEDCAHFALVINEAKIGKTCNVRLHSECITGDMFGSLRCDCGPQLEHTKHHFAQEGGIICYLRQEGRGIGLSEKIASYALQDKGVDTFAANLALGHPKDARSYGVAVKMLNALGVTAINLHTNNPDKTKALTETLDVLAVTPTPTFISAQNKRYLEAKVKEGHSLDVS